MKKYFTKFAMIERLIIIFLKKTEILSSISMRLVQITGKHSEKVHPKHLIKKIIWFQKYLNKNDYVLDYGCGSGQSCLRISKSVKKIKAVDIDQKQISIGEKSKSIKKIKNVEFRQANLEKKLLFKNNVFNTIICSDVLEHLTHRNFAIKEIHRVLKPGGILLLVTDNPATSWKRRQKKHGLFYYADPDHKYEYERREIEKLLIDNRFNINSVATATYDTPFKGIIDLTGGISLGLYKQLVKWKEGMVKKHPEETTGFRIVAQKI